MKKLYHSVFNKLYDNAFGVGFSSITHRVCLTACLEAYLIKSVRRPIRRQAMLFETSSDYSILDYSIFDQYTRLK